VIAQAIVPLSGGGEKSMLPVYLTAALGGLLLAIIVVIGLRSIGIGSRMR
jgi:hypothetical protein